MSAEYLREAMDLAGQARGQSQPQSAGGRGAGADSESCGPRTLPGPRQARRNSGSWIKAEWIGRAARRLYQSRTLLASGRTATCAGCADRGGAWRTSVAAMEDPNPRRGGRRLSTAARGWRSPVERSAGISPSRPKSSMRTSCATMRTRRPLVHRCSGAHAGRPDRRARRQYRMDHQRRGACACPTAAPSHRRHSDRRGHR